MIKYILCDNSVTTGRLAVNHVINMTAVYIADYAGALILALILLARGWDLPGRRNESRILLVLILASLFDNLIDPFIFLADGKPGMVNHLIVLLGTSFLFMYNLIVGTGVLALVVKHINKKISRIQYVTVWIITVIEAALLVVNFFTPIVFSIDKNNIYRRGPLYFVYIAAAFYLMLYSLAVYYRAQWGDGSVRYFPVWEFITPIVIGVVIQTVHYGISAQPVSFAIAFCSIVICLQKECLYIDKLTGVYNRYELEKILHVRLRRSKKRFAAFMIDMNGFKLINDNYSHKEGDEALSTMAEILSSVVGAEGDVMRFAGDEFVVILDSGDADTVGDFTARINAAIDFHNGSTDKPYKLSASIGGMVFDPGTDPDVIGSIDRLMYEDKQEYYREHDRRTR